MTTDIATTTPATTNHLAKVLDAEMSNGEWVPPRQITPSLRAQAKAALPTMMERASKPAQIEGKQEWLNSLGALVAGKMSLEEARARVEAYADLLDYPAGVFSKATLRRAGEKFTWFPSYAEVNEMLKAEHALLMKRVRRCQQIAYPPEPDVDRFKTREPPSAEQQAKVAEAIRQAGLDIKATTKSEPEAA